jgi:radical SAM protein with 4Fe4S-binding SPASM domain
MPECRECNIAGFCGGGCTFSAFIQHGSPNVGMCGQAREVLQYYCRKLGKGICDR